MSAYYNEIDPYAAQWLRNLIEAGHIAPGIVDERSIEDVLPSELEGFTQCHFFAGIGVWSLALRKSGWSDDRQVWTGSCPCQPFSAAGKAGGFNDERHLWPAFHHLIEQCKPDVVFGEQVASKDGLNWFDLVQADLEGSGYSTGAVNLCAAGIGAPHIRQRLWFVAERLADSSSDRREREGQSTETEEGRETRSVVNGKLPSGSEGCTFLDPQCSDTSRVADSNCTGSQQRSETAKTSRQRDTFNTESCTDRYQSAAPTNGYWRDVDWLFCRDGKWRPVEPGTFPLVDGAPSRVGRLRSKRLTKSPRVVGLKAYGNAINVEAAEAFIRSYIEC